MDSVNAKTIWIIGASSGIGKALAKELAKRGAKLALSARSEDKLKNLANELGDGHVVAPMDVTNEKEFNDARDNILKTFSRIDSVIYLAAIYSSDDKQKQNMAFISKIIDVNIKGAFQCVDVITPQFETQGSGQIVLCASIAGYSGLPNGQPYSATKAALLNLAESLKIEMESKNITVKVISPGFVKTQLTDQNDFDMPFIIEPEEAAIAIADGLTTSKFEIHFPKRLTFIMKFLRILPYCLYMPIARKINDR